MLGFVSRRGGLYDAGHDFHRIVPVDRVTKPDLPHAIENHATTPLISLSCNAAMIVPNPGGLIIEFSYLGFDRAQHSGEAVLVEFQRQQRRFRSSSRTALTLHEPWSRVSRSLEKRCWDKESRRPDRGRRMRRHAHTR
jgi:hypothetical protein